MSFCTMMQSSISGNKSKKVETAFLRSPQEFWEKKSSNHTESKKRNSKTFQGFFSFVVVFVFEFHRIFQNSSLLASQGHTVHVI